MAFEEELDEDCLDKMNEECGVFGIYAPGRSVAQMTYFGLFALQHRGQEGCGIAVSDGTNIDFYKNTGLVSEVFKQDILNRLEGYMAIGHVRYSTTGQNSELNTQPIVARYLQGQLALAHNGNLTNAGALRTKLATNGSLFQTTIDTEVIVNLIARHGQNDLEESLMKAMIDLKGSYSLVVMNEKKLYAVRDPFGNRPLCVGTLDNGGYVVASESCALDAVGAKFLRDVRPGEIIVIDEDGLHSQQNFMKSQDALCIFEYIYFARPDSNIDGVNVNKARRNMGQELARQANVDVDIVIPVPDSGTTAAIGYAEESGHTFTQGILKNRYAGRTFIQPTQDLRELMVKLKLNPIEEELTGKRVAVVDDSIVRGTTSRKLVQLLRDRGATEIHFLVSSPPVAYPCYYGIDTSDRSKLIAAQKDLEEIREYIGADSLHYLDLEGLLRAVGGERGFCTACLDGNYMLGLPDDRDLGKDALEK